MKKLENPNYQAKYFEKLNRKFNEIADNRFTKFSKTAFDDLKRITGYHTSHKKEGEIVSKILYEGEIISGKQMN